MNKNRRDEVERKKLVGNLTPLVKLYKIDNLKLLKKEVSEFAVISYQ